MLVIGGAVLYLVICILVGLVGIGKNIGFWGVFFIALLLSPLIGLIIGLVASKKQPVQIIYQQAPQPQYPPPQYQQPHTGKYAELEQLADMRNKGILTEEEFQREKDRILGKNF